MLGFAPAVRFSGPVDTLIHGTVIGEIEAVIREGLTNVAKHAQASQVTLEVSADQRVARGATLRRRDRDEAAAAEQRTGQPPTSSRRPRRLTDDRGPPPSGGTMLTWTIPIPD